MVFPFLGKTNEAKQTFVGLSIATPRVLTKPCWMCRGTALLTTHFRDCGVSYPAPENTQSTADKST